VTFRQQLSPFSATVVAETSLILGKYCGCFVVLIVTVTSSDTFNAVINERSIHRTLPQTLEQQHVIYSHNKTQGTGNNNNNTIYIVPIKSEDTEATCGGAGQPSHQYMCYKLFTQHSCQPLSTFFYIL